MIGALVFGAAALLAATADGTGELIAWRVAMGVGAAMIMPGTLATITSAFPAERRAYGVSLWSGFAAAGAIIGLVAAGALLERWSWESLFVVTGGFAAIAALAAALLAPETRDPEPARLDRIGAVLTSLAIGLTVFAIIEGNERGWTEPVVLVTAALAVAAWAAYVVAGLRTEHPLLDPRLFRIDGFRVGALTVLVQFMAVFGFFFVGLQYLQLILDYSPLHAAVALIPVAAVVLPTTRVTPALAARLTPRWVMTAGLVSLAAGMVWISTLTADSGYLPFLGGLILAGIGIGLTSATGTQAIVSSLPEGQQGVASAVNDATREVGAAVGIALMGSVYGSVYTDRLPAMSELPVEASDAVRDSAAGGFFVADQLGGDLGARLADGVATAFMDGLSTSLLVVAAAVVLAAVDAALRGPRGAGTAR